MMQRSNDLHFFYDAQDMPAMVRFNGVDYFYVYNLQGDVVAMIDANGTQVVECHYDAWGVLVSKTGSMSSTLGTVNPFRYRGYVYDEETGLYYLRSRYYNPAWKRFINADQSLSGKNLFSYCLENPINRCDVDGNESVAVIIGASLNLNGAIKACYAVAVAAECAVIESLSKTNPVSLPQYTDYSEVEAIVYSQGFQIAEEMDQAITRALKQGTKANQEKNAQHHIVPWNKGDAAPARNVLRAAGIDPKKRSRQSCEYFQQVSLLYT